jgi:hypothetical protein
MTKTKRNGGMSGQETASTKNPSKNVQGTAPTNAQPVANPPPVTPAPQESPWWKFWGGKRRKTKKGGFTPPSASSVTGVAAGAKMSCKQALGIASSKCKGGSKRRRKSRSIRCKK